MANMNMASIVVLLLLASTMIDANCIIRVRNDNDCRIICQLMTNCRAFTYIKRNRYCYPKKQSGWTKKAYNGAISGKLDFHSNEQDMDYYGGDLPEPC